MPIQRPNGAETARNAKKLTWGIDLERPHRKYKLQGLRLVS